MKRATRQRRKAVDAGVRRLRVDGSEQTISFRVVFSNRRTILLRVHPQYGVVVRAPHHTSMRTIDDIIRERAVWIADHQMRMAATDPRIRFEDGDTCFVFGQPLTLRVQTGGSAGVQLADDELRVSVHTPGRDAVESAVVRWYRTALAPYLHERTAEWMEALAPIGIRPYPVVIRRMETRWGSCSSKGRMTLNLRLLQAPLPLIDYVIAHELCHQLQMNHSPAYYAVLTEVMPDWKSRRKALASFPMGW